MFNAIKPKPERIKFPESAMKAEIMPAKCDKTAGTLHLAEELR